MLVVNNPAALREQIGQWRREGLTIAFVPTMGNLHQGHLTLVKEAHSHAEKVVVSIFVNPMQFDKAEDLANYPRTLEQDCAALEAAGVDMVFTPTPEIMYPQGLASQTFVEVPGLSGLLEGALRPGHFRGVSTVVTKLFNLVQPDVACFGQKDYQQLALIRKMVADMAMPIQIVGVPTVRAEDGLALSSRNGYLTAAERALAPELARTMNWIAEQIEAGDHHLPPWWPGQPAPRQGRFSDRRHRHRRCRHPGSGHRRERAAGDPDGGVSRQGPPHRQPGGDAGPP